MLQRHRNGRSQTDNTIIFNTFSMQCPKRLKIAFIVKEKLPNFIPRSDDTQILFIFRKYYES